MSFGVGDKVRIKETGKCGVIEINRHNGMYDISLCLPDGTFPVINRGDYLCGGSVRCLYSEELELVK